MKIGKREGIGLSIVGYKGKEFQRGDLQIGGLEMKRSHPLWNSKWQQKSEQRRCQGDWVLAETSSERAWNANERRFEDWNSLLMLQFSSMGKAVLQLKKNENEWINTASSREFQELTWDWQKEWWIVTKVLLNFMWLCGSLVDQNLAANLRNGR